MGCFDEGVPAGCRDADLEMRSLTDQAAHEVRLRHQGICTHGFIQTRQEGTVECLDCNKVFPSWDDMNDERRERLI